MSDAIHYLAMFLEARRL